AALRGEGFRCFIDFGEMAGGNLLSTSVERALRRSRVLVLVASPAAVKTSPYVRGELGLFAPLKRPIIPINVKGALSAILPSSPLNNILADRIWIDDDDGELATGPSTRVIGEIERSFSFIRRSRVRQSIAWSLVLGFAALSIVAEWNRETAARQRDAAL